MKAKLLIYGMPKLTTVETHGSCGRYASSEQRTENEPNRNKVYRLGRNNGPKQHPQPLCIKFTAKILKQN